MPPSGSSPGRRPRPAGWTSASRASQQVPNSAAANTNFNTYHLGIGTGVYWFMGGPGVDPHYNGTVAEARGSSAG